MLARPAIPNFWLLLSSLAALAPLAATTLKLPEPVVFVIPDSLPPDRSQPLVLDLGEVGSKQQARFELRFSPQDSAEQLASAFTSCSCIALEDVDASVGAPGPFVLRGRYDATWAAEKAVAEHQTITLKTDRRTIAIRAQLATRPSGSPQIHAFEPIDLAEAPSQIRLGHALPPGAQILRITPPADWRALDMRLDFDPPSGRLDWTFDSARALAWLRTRQNEFPHAETLVLQVFYATGGTPAPLTQLEVELSHPGHARGIPEKLDFGLVRAGRPATRRLSVAHGPLALLRLDGPADLKIQPVAPPGADPGRSAFDITFEPPYPPSSAGGAVFVSETLRARLSDGTTLRIPVVATLSPVKP